MQKDFQMDIIAEYYMGLRNYTPSEKYSDNYSRVYTSPDSDAWLVLERKGENAIQARITDETGVIISWDDYAVKNADIQLVDSPWHCSPRRGPGLLKPQPAYRSSRHW